MEWTHVNFSMKSKCWYKSKRKALRRTHLKVFINLWHHITPKTTSTWLSESTQSSYVCHNTDLCNEALCLGGPENCYFISQFWVLGVYNQSVGKAAPSASWKKAFLTLPFDPLVKVSHFCHSSPYRCVTPVLSSEFTPRLHPVCYDSSASRFVL